MVEQAKVVSDHTKALEQMRRAAESFSLTGVVQRRVIIFDTRIIISNDKGGVSVLPSVHGNGHAGVV